MQGNHYDYQSHLHQPISPVAGSRTVSASFPLSVTGALTTPLPIVAIPRYGTVLVLLTFALIIFQAHAMAILGA